MLFCQLLFSFCIFSKTMPTLLQACRPLHFFFLVSYNFFVVVGVKLNKGTNLGCLLLHNILLSRLWRQKGFDDKTKQGCSPVCTWIRNILSCNISYVIDIGMVLLFLLHTYLSMVPQASAGITDKLDLNFPTIEYIAYNNMSNKESQLFKIKPDKIRSTAEQPKPIMVTHHKTVIYLDLSLRKIIMVIK